MPIVATVEDVVDELEHVYFVSVKKVVDIGAEKLFKTCQRIQVGYWYDVAISTGLRRLKFAID